MKNSVFLKCSGFTLLEVLIAIVITSIGVLGLAGLQAASLRNNHSAYLRSQATLLAYDMADRMRANMGAIPAISVGAIPDSSKPYNYPIKTHPSTQPYDCPSKSSYCTPQEMAQEDDYEWKTTVEGLLPSGAGVVCLDGTPDDGTPAAPACDNSTTGTYAVKVWWDDDRSGTPLRFVTSFQP